MTSCSDLNQLRDFVCHDQQKLRERMTRLEKFRSVDPKQIKQSDRYTIDEWAHTSTREYNQQLEKFEIEESLNAGQREMMQQLNKLVWIGDHLKQIAADLRDHLNEVLGPLPPPARYRTSCKPAWKKPVPETSRATETAEPGCDAAPFSVQGAMVNDKPLHLGDDPVESTVSDAKFERQPLESLLKTDKVVEIETEAPLSEEDIEAIGTPDPKGAYKILGLPFTATDAQIGTAIRKMKLTLHPDRNAGHAEATAKFSDFNELMKETIANPARREAYDNVKNEGDMRELNKRLGLLTFGL